MSIEEEFLSPPVLTTLWLLLPAPISKFHFLTPMVANTAGSGTGIMRPDSYCGSTKYIFPPNLVLFPRSEEREKGVDDA